MLGRAGGEYWTYQYEYWKISTGVVLEYNVFGIFMFIILSKLSARVVLAPAQMLGLKLVHVSKRGP